MKGAPRRVAAASSRHRALRAVTLILLIALGSWARAESMRAVPIAAGASATARLEFQIIIPSVMIRDARSGEWRTNDKRLTLVTGTFSRPSGGTSPDDHEPRIALSVPSIAGTTTVAVRSAPRVGNSDRSAALTTPSRLARETDAAILQCAP